MELKTRYKTQLLKAIPVVSAMEVDIEQIEDNALVLSAPLNTNINYEGTAFGGSINTLCILSGYLLVHHLLKQHDIDFNSLVIQDSSINYIKPVSKNFKARSSITTNKKDLFLRMMNKKGKGRAEIEAVVSTDNEDHLVQFKARFAVS